MGPPSTPARLGHSQRLQRLAPEPRSLQAGEGRVAGDEIREEGPGHGKRHGSCRGGMSFLPPFVRNGRFSKRGILHYKGVDHLSTKGCKKPPMGS